MPTLRKTQPAAPTPHATKEEPWEDDELLDEEEKAVAASGLLTVTMAPEAARERLDKALAAALPSLSRSRLKALLDEGRVRADGRTITDASSRVKPGQIVTVDVPEPEPALPEPEDLPLTIVHEDEDVLVIDKAAGMVVHPAAGNWCGTLVNALLFHCAARLSGIGGVRRPGIVHRLDKDTSGLMVVAKNDRAHRDLTSQFADRTCSRTYLAVVWGMPPAQGEIAGNIGRSPTNRKRMAVLPRGGKPAITRYRVVRRFGAAAALVECKLLTGRTHQIRVHMTHIGHPLVGDPLYGRGTRRSTRGQAIPEPATQALVGFPRQALHAAAIEFRHPGTGSLIGFSSNLPNDVQELVTTLERIDA
ncbi:MAG TPA: RluA family pseudouridine synthase [Azospirillaceae bacterium]|nr:RluA family pseudouridine synthase [Azospirillaceae bacterium]